MKYVYDKIRLTFRIDPWIYGCEEGHSIHHRQAESQGCCTCGREALEAESYYVGTRKWVKRSHAVRLRGAA